LLEGESLSLRSVQNARAVGIAAMFQEFSVAPHLNVEENIMLGAEPRKGLFIDIKERRRRVRDALASFGFNLDPQATVACLSRAQQQMVEMTKALLTRPKVLILDEPTASLSEKETAALFELVCSLRESGVGIIYITHRIKEIEAIADRTTVMRDGKFIATVDTADVSQQRLVELMTGRAFRDFYPAIDSIPGTCVLNITGLSSVSGCLDDVSFSVRGGEVVGFAGLVGCGKSEIGRAIFGLERMTGGELIVNGKVEGEPTPGRMLDHGLCYITSDRRNEGLMLLRSTRENVTLSALSRPALSRFGFLRRTRESALAQSLAKRLRVHPLDIDKPVGKYSGGNQQKVLISKSLARDANVFIFDEPTVGIDVSARVEVYAFIKELVEAGNAVVVISSDLPEVLNLSRRVYVVRDGRLVDHMEGAEISESRALHGFFGTAPDSYSGVSQ
jgi:ribose transport system ATP-binding protein